MPAAFHGEVSMVTSPSPADEPVAGSGPDQPAQAAGPDTAVPAPDGAARLPHHKIRRTRISAAWVSVAAFAVVLLLLLIFILQNGHTVDVSYFGAHGHLPLGVALLLAAVAGVLLVAVPGAARIIQLRITARRHRRADARHLAGVGQPTAQATGARPKS
jgi:uncharacterized integral membrane protein